MLACQAHRCSKPCHAGPCEGCTVSEPQTCFCGAEHSSRRCGSGVAVLVGGKLSKSYACAAKCGKTLKCGLHACQQACHPGKCPDCERLPAEPQSCACGQQSQLLAALPPDGTATATAAAAAANTNANTNNSAAAAKSKWARRTLCTDALPTCGAVCDRALSCQLHSCPAPCHDSACAPCVEVITMPCRCGGREVSVSCRDYCAAKEANERRGEGRESKDAGAGTGGSDDAIADKFKCGVVCKAFLSCQKHKCKTVCCSGSLSHVPFAYLAHVCQKVCGKPLACGVHSCESRCHLGNCTPCSVVSRSGLVCPCGKTRVSGVVKCGTQLPPCRYKCIVPRSCNHPCIYPCHPGVCMLRGWIVYIYIYIYIYRERERECVCDER
jgi:transcriptional repressor NF-X1